MKKFKSGIALALVVALLSFSACTMPKKPANIPKIDSVSLSDTDKAFLSTNYKEYEKDIQQLLIDNIGSINEMFKLVNQYRYDNNIPLLEFDNTLCLMATVRAEEIVKENKFSHHRPNDKGYFSTIFEEYGLTQGEAGENLAKEFETAEEAFEAWKASPTHNECMLNSKWTKIGIGITQMKDGKYIWVQEFSTD